jgi:hypothetical protein
MIKPLPAASRQLFKSAVIACALTACAAGLEKRQPRLDTALVEHIAFKIGVIRQPTLAAALSRPDIAHRIAGNLAGWSYPVSAHDSKAASHTLTAEIGAIEYGETPTGFSFSAGDSDPRALGFQKTDVLPISCELTFIAQPEQTRYLHMDFAAGSAFGKRAGRAVGTDQLVDHISTVCFNLLNELDWPDKAPAQPPSGAKPGWMPEVRIETVTGPVEEEVEREEANAKAPGKVITSTSEGRKQIIIHNQGSPVILRFGHERR